MIGRSERLIGEEPRRNPDTREPFERDRDRVLYSPYFRRLAGVTQVTTPTEAHSFHNRLTHTLTGLLPSSILDLTTPSSF